MIQETPLPGRSELSMESAILPQFDGQRRQVHRQGEGVKMMRINQTHDKPCQPQPGRRAGCSVADTRGWEKAFAEPEERGQQRSKQEPSIDVDPQHEEQQQWSVMFQIPTE